MILFAVAAVQQGWVTKGLALFEHIQAIREIGGWVGEQVEPAAKWVEHVAPWIAEHWFGVGCFSVAIFIALRLTKEFIVSERAYMRANAPLPTPRPVVARPPRPVLDKLTIFVTDENGTALDEATVSGYSEDSQAPIPPSVTGDDGAAKFEASKGRKFCVFVAHAAYPGVKIEHVDGGEGVLPVKLKGTEKGVASLIITGGTGTLPGYPENRLGPKEGSPQNYVYINGLSVDNRPANPAYFNLNKWFTVEDTNRQIVRIRFKDLKGEVALLDYAWVAPSTPKAEPGKLDVIRQLQLHARADIRRRTEELSDRISLLTGEYSDASFRAERVAPDLDGALENEAIRIQVLFRDELLDRVQKLAAEFKRLGVSDEPLDAVLTRTDFLRHPPRIKDIQEIEARLALLPDKLDALE